MPFNLGFGELLVIGIVALIVIGPKDLPNMFRTVGRQMGRMRAMADDFRRTLESAADDSGFNDVRDDMENFSDFAKESSGVNEANAAIRDINNAKLDNISSSANAMEDELEAEANKLKETRRVKTEAIKADAKAEALRVQLEQAEREAAQKRAEVEKLSEPAAKSKTAKAATSKTKSTSSKKPTAKKPAATKSNTKKTASKPAKKAGTAEKS